MVKAVHAVMRAANRAQRGGRAASFATAKYVMALAVIKTKPLADESHLGRRSWEPGARAAGA